MESGNWNIYPDDFLSGWDGLEEYADPEFVHQLAIVPPPPAPVEPPTPPASSNNSVLRRKWKEAQAELIRSLETVLDLPNSIPSPGSPGLPSEPSVTPFDAPEDLELMDAPEDLKDMDAPEELQVMDTPEATPHGTKRTSSEPIESDCSSPKRRKKASDHQGTTSFETSATSRNQNDTEDKPHIKKPPNAFMLFRAEQRPRVVQELHITDSAKVNTVLGQRWKMLSAEEQAPYYEQAHKEKMAHQAKYPEWSTKDNFGKTAKKRKNNGCPVLTNQQHIAAPVAAAPQQPVMWLNTTHPMGYINQAHGSQAHNIQVLYSVCRNQKDTEDKPYIKKPPNAFMLFRAEQRPRVVQELHITDSAKVNTVLGQRWKMLSAEEQAPYYEQAHREKMAHQAKYPEWSTKDNFGKKAKRRKNNGCPVLTNQQHIAAPVAAAPQQPVMWLNTTHPVGYINQAHGSQAHNIQVLYNHTLSNQAHYNQANYNQVHYNHTQDNQGPSCLQHLPVETLTIDGVPVQGIPLETFLTQARDNNIHVLPLPSQPWTSASTTMNI